MTTQLMAVKTRVNHTPENYRPTEDEPFMSNRQRAYFRSKLLAWRNEILRSTKETRQHLHEESAQHPDLADRASSETERGVELRARDRQRKLIAKWHLRLLRRDWRAYQLDATGCAPGRKLERRGPRTPRAARTLL